MSRFLGRGSLAAVVLTAALCGQAVSTGAAASGPHRVMQPSRAVLGAVTGSLPVAASRSAPARVYLFAEPDPGRARVGQSFAEPVLASSAMTAGSVFRLAIPDNATARGLLLPGSQTMNIRVLAVSSRGVTSWFAPARTGRQTPVATVSLTGVGKLPRYNLVALRKAAALNGLTPSELVAGVSKRCIHDCIGCQWKVAQNKFNHATRIDEVHAASGVTAKYTHQTTADGTFTLGFKAEGASGWSADGTIGIERDAGTGQTVLEHGYYSHYFDGKYDYSRYVQVSNSGQQCPSAGDQKQNPTQWDGTIEPGKTVAGRKGNNCAGAVEKVTIQPNGSSSWKQKGKSVWWQTGVSTPMGFSFGDRTGYSANTKELWQNNNSFRSFLCGPHNDTSHFNQWDIVYSYNHA